MKELGAQLAMVAFVVSLLFIVGSFVGVETPEEITARATRAALFVGLAIFFILLSIAGLLIDISVATRRTAEIKEWEVKSRQARAQREATVQRQQEFQLPKE